MYVIPGRGCKGSVTHELLVRVGDRPPFLAKPLAHPVVRLISHRASVVVVVQKGRHQVVRDKHPRRKLLYPLLLY